MGVYRALLLRVYRPLLLHRAIRLLEGKDSLDDASHGGPLGTPAQNILYHIRRTYLGMLLAKQHGG